MLLVEAGLVTDVVLVEDAAVVPGLEDGLLTFEELVVTADPVPDVTPIDEDGSGAGAGVAGVAGAGVAGVAGAGAVFTLLVFDDVLLELSAKESGNAYCGKIKIAESKSGIKNFVFILPHLRWGVNKKL
jgi:hypothetical protein